MTDKAYAVPLHELLVGVPRDTRLEITDPDGMGTRFIPVGRYCHEAAEALRARLAQPKPDYEAEFIKHWNEGKVRRVSDGKRMVPEREWVGLTEGEYEAMAEQYVTNCYFDTLKYAKAIEAKLEEKNGY